MRICSSLFKCNYLKNKTLFLNFLTHLWNLHQILNIFEKKMIVAANEFPKLNTVKTWVDHSVESAVSEPPLIVNMLKPLRNLLERILSYILIPLRGNDLENISLIEIRNPAKDFLKKKNISSILCSIYGISIKF